MTWNFNIAEAPRGRSVEQTITKAGKETTVTVFAPDRVILATVCGKVLSSHFIPKDQRWEMLAKDEQPVAWQHWPEHPTPPSNANAQTGAK